MPGKLKKPDVSIAEYCQEQWGITFEKRGSIFRGVCPFHSHQTTNKNLRIWPSQDTYVCSCDPEGGTIWDMIAKHQGMPNLGDPDFDETIRHVCDVLGTEPELWEGKSKDANDKIYEVYREIKNCLQPVSFPSTEHPHFSQGRSEGEFLYRGIDTMRWLERGVGVLPPSEAKRIGQQFGPRLMKHAGLKGWKDNSDWSWLSKGVLILRRSHTGIPVGLAIRWYDPWCLEHFDGKYYKNSTHPLNRSREYLFGLSEVRSSGKSVPRVYVVEGEMDCLAMQLRAQPSVVSSGHGSLSEPQVELLRELGKEIVVVTDADANGAGQSNACDLAEKHPALKFMRLPMKGGEPMDPDTFCQLEGLEALESLPVESARMTRMMNEESVPASGGGPGFKWKYPEATAQKYLEEIADDPSAYSMKEVEYAAGLSGYPSDQMKSWLLKSRNRAAIQEAQSRGLPIEIIPVTP